MAKRAIEASIWSADLVPKKGFWTLVMDLNELPNRRFQFLKRYTFLKTGCGDSLERECMPVNCYSLARSSSSSAEL